jgi:hypothetical protein
VNSVALATWPPLTFPADKAVAWSIVFFTTVHTVAHIINFVRLANSTNTGVVGFIGANFLTGARTD